MNIQQTLDDLNKELQLSYHRVKYHTAEMCKYASWCEAARVGAAHMPGTGTAETLLNIAANCDGMRFYHLQNASTERESLTRTQDLLHDHNREQAQALRAAAEAADMAGAPGLAIELNRRAARAEGYDPQEDEADRAWNNEPTGPTHDLT